MAEVKKVKVCKKCSGFDVAELKGMVKVKDHTTKLPARKRGDAVLNTLRRHRHSL